MRVMDAVAVHGVEKRFGGVQALRGVSLTIPQGSSFGLIGPNGAGKTTLIKILLGITLKSAGDVTVLGGDPESVGVRRKVGYLPERLTLPPAFTPVQFLRGVARVKRLPSNLREQRIVEMLELVGLERTAWTRKCGKFSKGMKQRTGLAAAMLGDPALLILDEPTDGIDPLGRAEIRDAILAAKARGATIFLNSHLLAETERVCDHVAIMHQGRVVQTGGMQQLCAQGAFRVRFAPEHGDKADAVALGFAEQPDGWWHFQAEDAASFNAALAQAIGKGLVAIEVTQRMRDLEQVLAETVRGQAGPKPPAATAGGAA